MRTLHDASDAEPVGGQPALGKRRTMPRLVAEVPLFLLTAVAFAALGFAARKPTGVEWGSFAALFAVTALAGALGLRWLTRRRTAELADAIVVLRAIADGDLTRTFKPQTHGQSAEIASAVDRLVYELRVSLTMIDKSKALLTEGSEQIYEFADTMGETSEVVSAKALNAAAAAAEVTSHVHSVAASAEELATTIRSVAQHASEASTVASTAAGQARLANGTVQELQSASERVEEVVRLITNIAGQTHLLALNATIEAARAGEAGRGFAVVAAEVKQLAQETADATETVTRSLHEIRNGSAEAAGAMGRITGTIGTVSDNQTAIATAVEAQATVTQEIARSASAVAHGSDDMSRNITVLADVARTTAYGGAAARTTGGEIAVIRKILVSLTDKFTYEPVDLVDEVVVEGHLAVTVDGVTTVQNGVHGTGQHVFDYVGTWVHSRSNFEVDGTNSYSSMPDDVVHLRFHGRQVRFYGVTGPNHGIGAISVDDGPETEIDQYSSTRIPSVLLFDSGELEDGDHMLTLRVTGRCNQMSRYTWVAVDSVEVVH